MVSPLLPHVAVLGAPHPPLFPADPDDTRPAEKWWRRAHNDDVIAVSNYLLARQGAPDVFEYLVLIQQWKEHAQSHSQFERGLEHAQTLQHYGYDPLVLAALRGSRLPGSVRLLIASCGMSPVEAFRFAGQRPVDLAGLRTLIALRAPQRQPMMAP